MERETDRWQARLPADLQEHAVWPLRVEAHHDDGVPASSAFDHARAGADLLVSSAPHFAAPADVKVVFEAAGSSLRQAA